MDPLLLEQHFRSPLRLFSDPMLAQFSVQHENETVSAILLEKARQHLQLWGRTPYTDALLSQMYQRPNFGPFNLGLWQGQWPPQLSAGFLSAAAAAARTSPSSHASQSPSATVTQPTPIVIPSSATRGSPSPDLRHTNFARFSPYAIPKHVQSTSPLLLPQSSLPNHSRSSPNWHKTVSINLMAKFLHGKGAN